MGRITACKQKGFTLIELIIVIVILGVLAVVAAPRFIDAGRDAKISVLNNIAGQMYSTIRLVKSKAIIAGLAASSTNPNSQQSELLIDVGFGSSEVMFSNLCPESSAELGDAFDMLDFLDVSFNDDIITRVDNQYTLAGFILPATGTPLNEGCYIVYDSFATPYCTVTVVDTDC